MICDITEWADSSKRVHIQFFGQFSAESIIFHDYVMLKLCDAHFSSTIVPFCLTLSHNLSGPAEYSTLSTQTYTNMHKLLVRIGRRGTSAIGKRLS